MAQQLFKLSQSSETALAHNGDIASKTGTIGPHLYRPANTKSRNLI